LNCWTLKLNYQIRVRSLNLRWKIWKFSHDLTQSLNFFFHFPSAH
jgi:hypothetical protein